MLKTILAQCNNESVKRLLIALVISIVLHIVIVGGFKVALPFSQQQTQTIEARLVLPKAQPAPKVAEEKPAPPKEVKPKPTPRKANITKPEPLPTPEPIQEAQAEPVPAVNNPPEAPAPVLPPEPETEKVAEAPPAPALVQDEGLVINNNAYEYVETYFDVSTKIDGPSEGRATAVYDRRDAENYQIKFSIEARGLAALVLPELIQTSVGKITPTGLRPSEYNYIFGEKVDKRRKAVFDWPANLLRITTKDGTETDPIQDGTQDLLSFMYQFMYVAPLQTMQIAITNGKNLRLYDYAFEGEEAIVSKMGTLKTIHISHAAGETDEKTDIWLALEYQYLPVKIIKVDKNGKTYQFTANRVVTARPPIER